MSLTAEVLNSDAILNNFTVIGTLSFIPGEETKLIMKVMDSLKDIRYILPLTTLITATFNKTDGTTFTKAMAMWTDDRSVIETILEETETEDLSGGTVLLDFDVNGDASTIKKAIIRGALSREVGSC